MEITECKSSRQEETASKVLPNRGRVAEVRPMDDALKDRQDTTGHGSRRRFEAWCGRRCRLSSSVIEDPAALVYRGPVQKEPAENALRHSWAAFANIYAPYQSRAGMTLYD